MKLYRYSALNGEFMGEFQTIPDPLDPGRYIRPANTTEIEPTVEPAAGEVLRFNDDEWEAVLDLRGASYYLNGSQEFIRDIGIDFPEGASLERPPTNSEKTFSQQVNEERNRRVKAGATIHLRPAIWPEEPDVPLDDVPNDDIPPEDTPPVEVEPIEPELTILIDGSEMTQRNLLGLAQAASFRMSQGDYTHITKFRDDMNDIYDLTPPQVIELWSLGAQYVSEVFAASWELKDDYDPIPLDFKEDTYWPSRNLYGAMYGTSS